MKKRIAALAFAAAALCMQVAAQAPANEAWVGIWHADSDGLHTSTLTLADDTGALGGTIVLDMLSRAGGQTHVIASDPHVLMQPRVDGRSLSFDVRVKRRDGSVVTESFIATLTAPGKVDIHCVNCGAEAPVVELTRGQ